VRLKNFLMASISISHLKKLFPAPLKKKLPHDIKIVEVSVKTSQKLNTIYRNKFRATNVLSFRYDSQYGEILICPEVIRREAKEQGNSYEYQMTWYSVHAMIHLAGIHHERSKSAAKKAESLEYRILKQLFHY